MEKWRNIKTFYKFIQEYKHKITLNEVAPSPIQKDEIIGVLDGQQRLNSIYIALQGSYAYKKPRLWRTNPNAYPRRNLYLNLLFQADKDDVDVCEECGEEVPIDAEMCQGCGFQFEEEDSDIKYEFKFLTEDVSQEKSDDIFWFPVKKVLLWKDMTEADDYCDTIIEDNEVMGKILTVKKAKKRFKRNLVLLWQRINNDNIISYFEVKEQELDDILAIFVRVNSGGTVLSKSDLLFSTIVANWEDARDEIEELLALINKKGDGLNFGNDFIMRSCLVLTDCPAILKVQTFKKSNVLKIRNEWNDISTAIKKAVDLLVEFGFSEENLTSQMSIIPIAYYFKKKGIGYKADKNDKQAMREYLLKSLLKQIYGGQGVLSTNIISALSLPCFLTHLATS